MDTISQLTPSEVELLRASAGAQRMFFCNLTRKLTNENSDLSRLLKRTFLKALLANQEIGTLVCEVDCQGAPFGLLGRRRVLISANGVQYQWPEPSLEASIASLVQTIAGKSGALTIARLVRAWLRESAVGHFQAGIQWVFESMAERGWVQRTSERRLELFRLPSYEIPPETKRVVEQYSSKVLVRSPAASPQERLQKTDAMIAGELDKELRRALHM